MTLNVFVAIIAENFEEDAMEEENEGDDDEDDDEDEDKEKTVVLGALNETDLMTVKTKDLTKRFKIAWSQEDPTASHFIPKSRLRALLIGIGQPGGLPEKCTTDEYENYILSLNLSTMSDFLNYHDTLVALHRSLFKHIADTIPVELHSELEIDHETVHSQVIEKTGKRSRKFSRLGKKSSKQMILRHISETIDNEAKEDEDVDKSSVMLKQLQKSISFNILLRRVQRRWRSKLRQMKEK